MNETLVLMGIPMTASPLVYLLGRLRTRSNYPALAGRWLALVALSAAAVWMLLMARTIPATLTVGRVHFLFDGLSLLLVALVLMLAVVVTIFSFPYVHGEEGEEKYYAALLMMTGAMVGLMCAADLFNLWIWFELMSVSSYLLVTFAHEQPSALEAGIKYLVQSAVGSSFILFGIAITIAATGTTAITPNVITSPLALILLLVGFGVKAALVPLHLWLPDAHAQAPSGISALLSGVVIEVALVALLRSLAMMALPVGGLLMTFGAVNILVGNLMALPQTQLKRLLAYSSVSHMGYIVLGFGIALYTGTAEAAQAAAFHLVTHGLMKALAFLAVGAFMLCLNGKTIQIMDLAGAARRYPLLALALTLALLSLGGMPPLAGFMSKWQIFTAGFASQDAAIQGLVLFAALNSVLSLAYYTPIISVLYREKQSVEVKHGFALPGLMRIPLLLLVLGVLLLGIAPQLAADLTHAAGAALLAAFGA